MNSRTSSEEKPYDGRTKLGLSRSRLLLAGFFVFAGIMHFVAPAPYTAIVPKWLPNAPLLVVLSGLAEILGGLGVLLPQTRRLAGWGLIALLVAVFPANIHMLELGYANHEPAYWIAALWFRLPLQLLMLWWVWRAAARPSR